MRRKLKELKENTLDRFLIWYRKKFLLKNSNFSIISNNCWGGRVYQRFGLPYTSPTVGLMMYADEYIRFVTNLQYYLSLELKFIPKNESKYYEFYAEKEKYYPIGLLDDVEVVFLHYKSEEEAREKWNRRKARINWDNLIVKFNDQNRATEEHIRAFDKLPYKNKLCFVANPVLDTECTIHFKEYSGESCIKNDITSYTRYLNIEHYLNTHTD